MARAARRFSLLLALLLAGPLRAGEVFYDYADVTSVRPVLERASPAANPGACRPPFHSDLGDGEAVTGEGIGTLAEALRRELDRLTDPVTCRSVSDGQETIVGYQVTYRYGDTEYTRVMEQDPGPRMRVRVRLDAGR
jgi:hypothetical protein